MQNQINQLESESTEHTDAMNKIIIQLLSDRKKEIFRIWVALIVLAASFAVTAVAILYDAYFTKSMLLTEISIKQSEYVQALKEERQSWIAYLETIEVTTTTEETTTTMEDIYQDTGDNSSLINGNQYNDNAVHENK